MVLSEKDRILHSGNLVVNFANAMNTDMACRGVFRETGKALNYSDGFKRKAINDFPFFTDFKSSLSQHERVLAKLMIQERNLLSDLKKQFSIRDINEFQCAAFTNS